MPPIADQRASNLCLTILGRKILLWQPQPDRCVLSLFDPLEGRQEWQKRKFAAGARLGMVGKKAVGVMEPGGRFLLLSLPDGHTIADLKLEAEPSLGDITLLEWRGKYFLQTSDSAANDAARQTRLPGKGGHPKAGGQRPRLVPLCPSKLVHEGRLYAFDGHGKLLWPAPVKIENQFLPLDQPPDLPVLTFVCRVQEREGGRFKTAVLCIDKRNGRTVYQAEDAADFMIPFQCVGDAQKKTVDLVTWTNTVTLTFTDKPWPSGSAAAAAAGK